MLLKTEAASFPKTTLGVGDLMPCVVLTDPPAETVNTHTVIPFSSGHWLAYSPSASGQAPDLPAVHLFADGVLHDISRNFHKIALRSRAFCHAPMMPRIHCSRIACGKDKDTTKD